MVAKKSGKATFITFPLSGRFLNIYSVFRLLIIPNARCKLLSFDYHFGWDSQNAKIEKLRDRLQKTAAEQMEDRPALGRQVRVCVHGMIDFD